MAALVLGMPSPCDVHDASNPFPLVRDQLLQLLGDALPRARHWALSRSGYGAARWTECRSFHRRGGCAGHTRAGRLTAAIHRPSLGHLSPRAGAHLESRARRHGALRRPRDGGRGLAATAIRNRSSFRSLLGYRHIRFAARHGYRANRLFTQWVLLRTADLRLA